MNEIPFGFLAVIFFQTGVIILLNRRIREGLDREATYRQLLDTSADTSESLIESLNVSTETINKQIVTIQELTQSAEMTNSLLESSNNFLKNEIETARATGGDYVRH